MSSSILQDLDSVESSSITGTPTATDSSHGTKFSESEVASEFPKCIPPTHSACTLVLCFDGTGDQFDSDNSNIVEFFTMLKKDDREKQMVYYQAGIGTYTSPKIATPLAAKISKTLDEMIAWNLDAHVMDGYEFLMQNYKAGDRICIFGFSRGAYTARSLAGMIHKVGLLPACNHQQVPFAYKMFTRVDEIGWQQSNVFKKAFSVDVPIEFIGVWDTVNSVGLIPRRLPFTTSNTIVRTFRHAIALDERRAKFKANLWNRPNEKEAKMGTTGQTPDVSKHKQHDHSAIGETGKRGSQGKKTLRKMERRYADHLERPTDVEEVWFAGCHCDVGGGSVANGTPHTLARIPLRWMIRECFKADTGIMFMSESLKTVGLDPASLYPYVQERPPPLPGAGAHVEHIPSAADRKAESSVQTVIVPLNMMSEEEHELHDAMSPIYDQLSLAPFWWLLELFPIEQRYQKGNKSWSSYIGINLGRGRFIPKQKKRMIKIHRSVKQRMDAQYSDGTKYKPKASFETALAIGNVNWVD
ncbi:hypothetical protein E4T56_gene19446 [Termitomyces sp. T112]|nr:hypothetical protein C0989_002697 [Termitomyces sp. Mn162]KAG5728069.1 hypothetical protein E4T56_gene19446 [Termitomyces sp. T112]KAH0586664.1 hypothetical protein H2248_007883 [Termitomyces sp. 'cryptogamus']KNZ75241.1 hypothetical protein J132_03896 [Termitomyces sp. J132]